LGNSDRNDLILFDRFKNISGYDRKMTEKAASKKGLITQSVYLNQVYRRFLNLWYMPLCNSSRLP